jgi:hypothetical protein
VLRLRCLTEEGKSHRIENARFASCSVSRPAYGPNACIDTIMPDEVGDRLFSATNQGINQLGATAVTAAFRRRKRDLAAEPPKSAAEGRTHGAAEEEMHSGDIIVRTTGSPLWRPPARKIHHPFSTKADIFQVLGQIKRITAHRRSSRVRVENRTVLLELEIRCGEARWSGAHSET